MAGWTRTRQYEDPTLGTFTRRRDGWYGQVRLDPSGVVPLVVPGSRHEPDADARALAGTVQREFDLHVVSITEALRNHRTAATGVGAGGLDIGGTQPTYVRVIVLDGSPTIEIGYRVDWDDDHTLGALLRNGRLVEFNGSVLEPRHIDP